MTTKINEESALTFTVVPINTLGKAFTPTSARYRLDDTATSTEIVAWTAITPAESMEVVIPASANAIINNNLSSEQKTFTFQTDYGAANQHSDEVIYAVTNLAYVP
jgi:hypothetical protein